VGVLANPHFVYTGAAVGVIAGYYLVIKSESAG